MTGKPMSGRDLKAMLAGGVKPSAGVVQETQQTVEKSTLTNWLGKPNEPMTADDIYQALFGEQGQER